MAHSIRANAPTGPRGQHAPLPAPTAPKAWKNGLDKVPKGPRGMPDHPPAPPRNPTPEPPTQHVLPILAPAVAKPAPVTISLAASTSAGVRKFFPDDDDLEGETVGVPPPKLLAGLAPPPALGGPGNKREKSPPPQRRRGQHRRGSRSPSTDRDGHRDRERDRDRDRRRPNYHHQNHRGSSRDRWARPSPPKDRGEPGTPPPPTWGPPPSQKSWKVNGGAVAAAPAGGEAISWGAAKGSAGLASHSLESSRPRSPVVGRPPSPPPFDDTLHSQVPPAAYPEASVGGQPDRPLQGSRYQQRQHQQQQESYGQPPVPHQAIQQPEPQPVPVVEAPKEIYERIAQVGEGTYGKVYKARNTENNSLVAMKRIRMEAEKDGFPITAIREIKLLQGLRHANIVNLVEMVVSKGHVYMVFEYLDHDLSGVLHHPTIHFTEAHVKSLMWQLLAGLKYMHHHGVLHRDLKGSNILLSKGGELKIADFGLARRYERGREKGLEGRGRGRDYTNRVITLWYKPPELLLGATVYAEEVDMWSAGAIFLELFTRRPVIQAGDEIEQLHNTFKLIGTPTPETWADASTLPWYELVKPKTAMPSKLRETLFGEDKPVKREGAMKLAEKLLEMDPAKRPSASEAMAFEYFATEEPQMEMPWEPLSNVKGEWHELESKRARRGKKSN